MTAPPATDSDRSGDPVRLSRLFTGLCAFYVVALVLSNLMACKLTAFCGLTMDAGNLLFPVTYVLGDVFTEVYGFRQSRFVIWLGFGASFLAVVVYAVAVALPHPACWTSQEAFRTVFALTPRLFLASLAAYLAGEFSNACILSRLKVLTKGRFLWLRTIGSTLVGEGLDTLLFVTIAFSGVVSGADWRNMILSQYLWKVAYEIALTPVTYRVVAWLKARERLDVYDRNIRYGLFG